MWHCVRQRAGPLVKECRALRPRLTPKDTAQDARSKRDLQRYAHSAVCRTQVDRLELKLALFGFEGTHYTCTYDSLHLPHDFDGVRRSFRAFAPGCSVAEREHPMTGSVALRACTEIIACISMLFCVTARSRRESCGGSGQAAKWMWSQCCSERVATGGWQSI